MIRRRLYALVFFSSITQSACDMWRNFEFGQNTQDTGVDKVTRWPHWLVLCWSYRQRETLLRHIDVRLKSLLQTSRGISSI